MNTKLKQPKKYTHNSLTNKKQHQDQQQCEGQSNQANNETKTKKINKLHDKKVINKKNQPSALRLAAINQTFHKIENNADKMIHTFNIDQEMFKKCIGYDSKVKCKCNRNIKYYCLKCMYKNPQLQFPVIKLPLNVKVVHHSSEKINKSSIIPMALLSQEISLEMFSPFQTNKKLLNGLKIKETFILFPHKNSKKVSEMKDIENIKNIVVLDCTWFQTDQLISILEGEGYNNFIRLQDYQSLYWRYNHHNDKALSSAEALIYFFREYQISQKLEKEKYDDLMFLYCLNLKIIEQSYRKQGQKREEVQQEERMENN